MSESRDNKLLGIKMEEDIDRSKILEKTFEKLAEMEKSINLVTLSNDKAKN